MTRPSSRIFEARPAVRSRVPLIIGITGASSSGKTFSALRLAAGIERVVGGPIYGIDTESERMLHYADYFKFAHVPFSPPHGPLDYLAAIDFCVSKKARIIVIDSMSHEHEGEGGVLDQSERMLDEKCGNDWDKRNRNLMMSFIRPKAERKKLNRRIVSLGDVIFILCYRAADKIKPEAGKEPIKLGWQAITTSDLVYEMTARYLLEPGSVGRPTLVPVEKAAQMMVKNPRQFQGWLKPGEQLGEDLGERLARWAREGGKAPAAAPSPSPAAPGGERSSSSASPAPAAGAAASQKRIDLRMNDLAKLRRQIGWTVERGREWIGELFGGESDPTRLTSQQLDDALTLLDLLVSSGRAAFDAEREALAELGRVSPAAPPAAAAP